MSIGHSPMYVATSLELDGSRTCDVSKNRRRFRENKVAIDDHWRFPERMYADKFRRSSEIGITLVSYQFVLTSSSSRSQSIRMDREYSR
jgi:hypothetical protein